jgi:hypothetical protein
MVLLTASVSIVYLFTNALIWNYKSIVNKSLNAK